MSFSRRRHLRKKRRDRSGKSSESGARARLEGAKSESEYLKSLVDSHMKVTVVLKSGERFCGHIRYYDRHCFSVGLSARGPRIFLRKESVSYIAEDQPTS